LLQLRSYIVSLGAFLSQGKFLFWGKQKNRALSPVLSYIHLSKTVNKDAAKPNQRRP
jgi:hypothetical protein